MVKKVGSETEGFQEKKFRVGDPRPIQEKKRCVVNAFNKHSTSSELFLHTCHNDVEREL